MNYYLLKAIHLLILIPTIIGIVRYRRMNPAFHPVVWLMITGLIFEIIHTVLSMTIRNNTWSFNSFLLFEGLILLWQFKRWKIFRNTKTYRSIQAIYIASWSIYYIAFGYLNTFYSHFLITHNFFFAFLSIHYLNKLIATPEGPVIKNARFIFSLGFVLYFSQQSVLAAFWLFDLSMPQALQTNINLIFGTVNAIGNLIYAFAMLRVPDKQAFVLSDHRKVAARKKAALLEEELL